MVTEHTGEFVSLIFMAFALSLDAFSMSLSIGIQRPGLRRIIIVGLIIGLFHMVLPLIGIGLGYLILAKVKQVTNLLGGMLLIGIGLHMFFSAFSLKERKNSLVVGMPLFLLTFGVSIDSFSVGLSLGMSGTKILLAIILFAIFSTTLTWIGMLIGRRVHGFLGAYSELLGGSILCALGLNILFS